MTSERTSAPDQSTPTLEVDGLGLTLPPRRNTGAQIIFNEVSFTLPPGQALCLAGRSGVGKTSVLRACAGFVPTTEGTISWRGASMNDWNESDWETWRTGHLGFLDQDSEMLADLRMIENVMIPLTQRGPAGLDRAQELLSALAVDHVANAWPQSCSGGERQRCGVARALIGQPDILILDEPTASLDTRNAHRVLDVLDNARSAGTALLIASHDNLVIDWADEVVTIEG
ncbi:MAG TPA: ATP-binding cassette domain-containing protein [Humibacter sp.]|nr:ATP-binding cassette domain-containing protein [Humibacter sp.]